MGRTVSVKLLADVAQFTREIGGRSVGAVKSLSGELDKAAKRGKLDTVATHTAALGLGLTGVAAAAIKMRMDFDKSMSAAAAATKANAQEMSQLKSAALDAGKATQFSATQAADGITELGKAGVSTQDILGGGLAGALDLAAAGQISVGEAAETAASALTQFKLKGNQVPHVADLLAAAAGKAQGSVHDMGYALNQSGLVASQFGLSIEDTTGALAEFASAGLIGSDAGTSFKTMLLAMANPSKQTKDLMDDLGISFYDAHGQFVGLAGVAQVLQARLHGLTDAQRQQALGQIFGNDAIRSASILYSDGAAGVQKWAKAVNDSGYAQATAAKLTDNLAGDLERLKGSLETLAIQSGGGANEGLRKLAQGANSAVDAFSSLPGWVQQTITVLSGVGGASLLAGAGFIKARGTVRDFMAELREMGPTGTKAADGIARIGSAAGKVTLVGTAVLGVYEGFKLFSDWAEKRTAPTRANIDALTDSIKEFAATGKATGELAARYGQSLSQIGHDVAAVTKGMADLKAQQDLVKQGLSDPSVGENWNPVDPQVVQRIKDLDTALTKLVQGGGASQARIFLQQLQASGHLTAQQFQQLTSMLPQYTAAAGSAAVANSGLAKGFGSAEANAKTLTGTLESAADAGQALTDVWTQLHGALLSTDKAMLAANNSIQDVKKSFQENGRAIDGNSTAALRNRVAVGEAAKAAVAAAQAKFEETGSVSQANRIYDAYLGQLRKTLTQSGLTKKQVDNLIGAYAKMPRSVATNVSITGDKPVGSKLTMLSQIQSALKRGAALPGPARAYYGPDYDRTGHAEGGWTGPGGKWDEAGVVHADEFVIKKESRKKIEAKAPGLLDEMNATGQVPGYAGGGRVIWPYPVTAAMTRIPPKSEVMSAVTPSFGHWPSSPGAQRGDSGVWRKILALVKASGIPYEFGNAYRPGDPLWHGSGRAIDFTGYNQDRLAQFFLARQSQVLELIHRTKSRDYGITRGHYNAMPHQWPLHRNHLHIAMAGGGVINEPVYGYGLRSGSSYSFGERGTETVTPGVLPSGGNTTIINVSPRFSAGTNLREAGRQIAEALQPYLAAGGSVVVRGKTVLGAG